MSRNDETYEHPATAPWLRTVLLPFLVLAVVVAIVCGLVFGGAIQGHKAYAVPAGAPATQPTVLIAP